MEHPLEQVINGVTMYTRVKGKGRSRRNGWVGNLGAGLPIGGERSSALLPPETLHSHHTGTAALLEWEQAPVRLFLSPLSLGSLI